MNTADWYAVTCPDWCTTTHPAILAGLHDPARDDLPDLDILADHGHVLATLPDGLRIELCATDAHPSAADLAQGPAVFVYLPSDHETTGATPATLTAWADALTAAARLAEELTA